MLSAGCSLHVETRRALGVTPVITHIRDLLHSGRNHKQVITPAISGNLPGYGLLAPVNDQTVTASFLPLSETECDGIVYSLRLNAHADITGCN